MSAIQKELCSVCEIDPSKYGNDRKSLLADLVKRTDKLSDGEWNRLTPEAQDWFNKAADATKAKEPVQDFPDYKADGGGESRSRRRSADDEPAKPAKGESMAVEKLQEGDRVKVTTKRGKVIEGSVLENSKRKEYVVVKGADGEDEIDWDKVEAVEVFHGTAGLKEEVGPGVGDEVKFTTKRGKTVSGVITELTGETIVLDKTDDYDMDRIDGDIIIVKKGSGNGNAEPETRRRGSSSDDDGDKRGGGRVSNEKGVSVGGRIRELLAEDPTRTQDDVGKVLKKEKIDFREASLRLIYNDSQRLINLLREAGHMKGASGAATR
jgi:hypothetical protein